MSDIPDALGVTPLLYAARCGHGAVADILLSEGAHIDFRDMSCKTALQWATSEGHWDVVNLLRNRAAGAETTDGNHGR